MLISASIETDTIKYLGLLVIKSRQPFCLLFENHHKVEKLYNLLIDKEKSDKITIENENHFQYYKVSL